MIFQGGHQGGECSNDLGSEALPRNASFRAISWQNSEIFSEPAHWSEKLEALDKILSPESNELKISNDSLKLRLGSLKIVVAVNNVERNRILSRFLLQKKANQ